MEEIEHLFNSMVEEWNRHDARAYAAHWAEDCDFVNVVGFHRQGRKELLAELEYLYAGRFKNTCVEMKQTRLRFLTADIAVAHLRWRMTGDPGQPGYPTVDGKRRGIFTHVMQRTPGGWRCVASQNTDTLLLHDFLPDLVSPLSISSS